jgi:hypothetical protein
MVSPPPKILLPESLPRSAWRANVEGGICSSMAKPPVDPFDPANLQLPEELVSRLEKNGS